MADIPETAPRPPYCWGFTDPTTGQRVVAFHTEIGDATVCPQCGAKLPDEAGRTPHEVKEVFFVRLRCPEGTRRFRADTSGELKQGRVVEGVLPDSPAPEEGQVR